MPELAGRYNQEFVQVKANTLDNILDQIGVTEVNWLKIDVDGAELDVLNGAYNTLSRNDLILFIETHDQDRYHKVEQILKLHNFRVLFEKSYDFPTKHVIAKKKTNLTPIGSISLDLLDFQFDQ